MVNSVSGPFFHAPIGGHLMVLRLMHMRLCIEGMLHVDVLLLVTANLFLEETIFFGSRFLGIYILFFNVTSQPVLVHCHVVSWEIELRSVWRTFVKCFRFLFQF